MAETKKTAKAAAKAAPVKEEKKVEAEIKEAPETEAKETAKAEVKEASKAETKKAAPRKTAAKKAPVKTAAQEKKAPVKKAAAVKKEAVKEAVHFQFSGKSYTPDDLLKICRDVWKYDLNGKEEDFKSVELYVKPEENTTYYVINGNITGSFFI